MSRKGNCWDNAPQESFFGHMKDHLKVLPSSSHQEISKMVADYINYYNNDEYQWSLAKLSPNEYYAYITTGVYPLPVTPPEDEVFYIGGSAPKPLEFNALVSKEGEEKDDTE